MKSVANYTVVLMGKYDFMRCKITGLWVDTTHGMDNPQGKMR